MEFTMYTGFAEGLAMNGIEKTVGLAAETGFSSVEILEYLIPGRELVVTDLAFASKIKRELDRHGLGVACYTAYAYIWKEQTSQQDFHRALDNAAELGAPYFQHTILPWGKPPVDAPSFEDGIKLAVETAIKVAEYAKPLGITCIYEDQGIYTNGVSGFGDFYWEVKKNCANVGICGDFANIIEVAEKPEDFLSAFRGEIAHVHIKDCKYLSDDFLPDKTCWQDKDNNWMCNAEIGKGIVDMKSCLKVLKESGYQGAYALEDALYEPYSKSAQQVMEYLRKTMSEV